MKRITLLWALCVMCITAMAQQNKHFHWAAYGLSFDAPRTMAVEEDSEEAYVVSNTDFYLTVQTLDADGIHREELPEILADYVEDDAMDRMEKTEQFETWQFYVASVNGQCDEDRCRSLVLMAKDGSCAFYVSVVFAPAKAAEVQPLVESFTLEDE
jgi:hypothetical protein